MRVAIHHFKSQILNKYSFTAEYVQVHPCHHILTDEMFRYEEVSILEGSVLGPGPHYWGLGAQQTKARPAKRYRKCLNILTIPCTDLINQSYNKILFIYPLR